MTDQTTDAPSPFPLSVITGFLGSGKTTLLNRLLKSPDMEETAVLINEFGEVGIDHLLVEQIDENTVLLNSGCICCSIRGDLAEALRDLFKKRVDNSIPKFKRVVVETTGLADPAPIIHTLMTDPFIERHYRLDGVVSTVDGLFGLKQITTHREVVKQIAVADRVVMTKMDLTEEADTLRTEVKRLNPGADIIEATMGAVSPDRLFNAGLYKPESKSPDVAGWLRDEAYHDGHGHGHGHHHHHHHDHEDRNRHGDNIRAFCLELEAPVNWDGFMAWLEMVLSTKGESLLRVKGVLNVAGQDKPIAIHGVQHVFHPPVALPDWPDDHRTSKIVFITDGLSQEAIEKTFKAFNQAAG